MCICNVYIYIYREGETERERAQIVCGSVRRAMGRESSMGKGARKLRRKIVRSGARNPWPIDWVSLSSTLISIHEPAPSTT